MKPDASMEHDDISSIPPLPPDAFEFVQMDEVILDAKFETEPMGFMKDAILRFATNRASVVAFIILSILVFMSIIGPNISGYTYREQNLRGTNLPPRVKAFENLGIFDGSRVITVRASNIPPRIESGSYIETLNTFVTMNVEMAEIRINAYIEAGLHDTYFWFGTDAIGRCLFTRVWYGLRISLLLGFVVTVINISIGIVYGAVQGYFGGYADLVMQRITEILSGIPTLVVVTLTIIFFGAGFHNFVVAFILTGWIGASSTTRMQFYRFKNREYVYAANSMGASDWRIIFRHILPNASGTMITSFALMIPGIIGMEAFLAFLGIGLQAPTPTLGILNVDGQTAMLNSPHILLFPASVISILMICFNIFGNGLRDAFNPQLRGSQ